MVCRVEQWRNVQGKLKQAEGRVPQVEKHRAKKEYRESSHLVSVYVYAPTIHFVRMETAEVSPRVSVSI